MKLEIPPFELSFSIPYWGIALGVVAAVGAVYWVMR